MPPSRVAFGPTASHRLSLVGFGYGIQPTHTLSLGRYPPWWAWCRAWGPDYSRNRSALGSCGWCGQTGRSSLPTLHPFVALHRTRLASSSPTLHPSAVILRGGLGARLGGLPLLVAVAALHARLRVRTPRSSALDLSHILRLRKIHAAHEGWALIPVTLALLGLAPIHAVPLQGIGQPVGFRQLRHCIWRSLKHSALTSSLDSARTYLGNLAAMTPFSCHGAPLPSCGRHRAFGCAAARKVASFVAAPGSGPDVVAFALDRLADEVFFPCEGIPFYEGWHQQAVNARLFHPLWCWLACSSCDLMKSFLRRKLVFCIGSPAFVFLEMVLKACVHRWPVICILPGGPAFVVSRRPGICDLRGGVGSSFDLQGSSLNNDYSVNIQYSVFRGGQFAYN
ncbi:uncharacterized protein MYCFIDRAFT_180145 [Pseudocercospora fijiensis CIRAD86]|uniref:Uncharacterized protein n=1 Tax=Pseudocercospora fijiensis (strain CIRAD86) TaxID=383855 RepID=M3AI24_PSEFD|nr:uncharacterized protein MYCFIDRAFT_180145 [Pseudocercospora fijiensis CIRAD86]EME77142.1 hypothetical protein MYCFIDRAFT_180145 [Pseudocercospora fijiensis CIRAD86]